MLRLLLLVQCLTTLALASADSLTRGGDGLAASPDAAVAGVCQPTFSVDRLPRTTGTAFLIRTRASHPKVLAISAHHLLGLPTGPLPWGEAPRHVQGARCPTLDEARVFEFGPAYAVPGAHVLGDLASLNDIAVFGIGSDKVSAATVALELADADPRPGQIVWLLARTKGQPKSASFLHRARLVASTGYLGYVFDEPLNMADTSGAPLVDASGMVVGVNVGAGHVPSGAVFGVADTLATIRAALAHAMAPSVRRDDRGVGR